jgi:hypothetical protein
MSTTTSTFCPDTDTVLWECGIPFDQQSFTEHCADAATGLPRYCCPTEFIFDVYPGCAIM